MAAEGGSCRPAQHAQLADRPGKGALHIETAHRFHAARKDPSLAVLEGFHAIKHALRFDAELEWVVTRDLKDLMQLCESLAPDVTAALRQDAAIVPADVFAHLAPVPPATGVMAIARRRTVPASELLMARRTAPLVLLERPTQLGNMGAAVRVAASAGAAGVVTTGRHDPWHPTAIRGAAGLQYAVPVARAQTIDDWQGPLVALDPAGQTLAAAAIPAGAVLAFGSERTGLTAGLLAQATQRIAIPMVDGVSSLNLATAVAVVLYTWRLGQ